MTAADFYGTLFIYGLIIAAIVSLFEARLNRLEKERKEDRLKLDQLEAIINGGTSIQVINARKAASDRDWETKRVP